MIMEYIGPLYLLPHAFLLTLKFSPMYIAYLDRFVGYNEKYGLGPNFDQYKLTLLFLVGDRDTN